MNKVFEALVIGALAALLTACGGGGTDEASSQMTSAQGALDARTDESSVAAEVAANSTSVAQRYSFTVFATLGGKFSAATGINNAGQVVGYSSIPGDASSHATLWKGNAAIDLGTLGGTSSWAWGINDAGHVVGQSTTAGDASAHATLWVGTTAVGLGTLGGTVSGAVGINNAGQIVGQSYTSGDASAPATLWSGTSVIELGTLGGTIGAATAINNSAQIVGWSSTTGNARSLATLWNGTVATDLNRFLDVSAVTAGWILENATGINDHGWIVGDAYNSRTGQYRAFLLTPLANKEQCKNGGWQSFGFQNQGQCIQFLKTAGK